MYASLPLSPRKLGTSLRIRGKLTLRIKGINFLYSKTNNKEMTHTKKPSPLVGEGVSGADGRGKLEQERKNESNLCTQTCPYRLA